MNLKPNDKIVIQTKYGCDLYHITRITPTGRIVCSGYTFNKNLTLRGKSVLNIKAWVADKDGIKK